MKKKCLNILLFSLLSVCSYAQTEGYKFYSQLDSVKESGFYNIELTPELAAHLKTDYSDVRIVNDSNKWVPHQLRIPDAERSIDNPNRVMNIIRKSNSNSNSELIVLNNDSAISTLKLILRNTAVERYCSLTGSDDLQNWFIINDSVLLKPEAREEEQSFMEINFPSSNYKYFKVSINNNGKYPLNIFEVHCPSNVNDLKRLLNIPEFNPLKNPPASIIQKDSSKISFVKITQLKAYHFNKIRIKVSGVKYFYRKADLYVPDSNSNSFANPGKLNKSFTISNNSNLEFYVPSTNAKEYYLLIYNEDNLPLKVDSVETWNSLHVLTAYLEKGDSYKLILDNPLAVVPTYDLERLSTTFYDSLKSINTGPIIAYKTNTAIPSFAKTNKWLLWSAIIVVLIILLFFTQKMIKEVDKRKQHDNI